MYSNMFMAMLHHANINCPHTSTYVHQHCALRSAPKHASLDSGQSSDNDQ